MGGKLVFTKPDSKPAIDAERRSLRSLLAENWKGAEKASELSRGSPQRTEALRQLLTDGDPVIRRDAGWALHYMMAKCTEPLPAGLIASLGERLGDDDPNVRSAAIHALSGYQSSLIHAGVSPQSINEILSPAMPNVKKYGYDRSPSEKDFGVFR